MHYNPPGIRGEPRFLEGVVRFTKLHGSIDWASSERLIKRFGLPFGASDINPFLKESNLSIIDAHNLIIYPNSAKDREMPNIRLSSYLEILLQQFAGRIIR
jgi:hypothetical protein